MPQWIVRDYFARRGHAAFHSDQIIPSRCALLGYSLQHMRIEGYLVPVFFLQVDQQPQVGAEAFDAGAAILTDFFHAQLQKFLQPNLAPLGRTIIECCMQGGTVQDFEKVLDITDS